MSLAAEGLTELTAVLRFELRKGARLFTHFAAILLDCVDSRAALAPRCPPPLGNCAQVRFSPEFTRTGGVPPTPAQLGLKSPMYFDSVRYVPSDWVSDQPEPQLEPAPRPPKHLLRGKG